MPSKFNLVTWSKRAAMDPEMMYDGMARGKRGS